MADLAEGGIVILFADGSPPELAEVSVLHKAERPQRRRADQGRVDRDRPCLRDASPPLGRAPGPRSARSAMWSSISTAPAEAERPGEICASEVDAEGAGRRIEGRRAHHPGRGLTVDMVAQKQ